MTRVLIAGLLMCCLCAAQSFDRLMIRPRSQGGSNWDPGAIRFYDSRWPAAEADIEYTGIQAREDLDRYTLTLPPAGPLVDSCFIVDEDGIMSYAALGRDDACKSGSLRLLGKHVGLGSQEEAAFCGGGGCPSWEMDRHKEPLTIGIPAFFMRTWPAALATAKGAWMFAIPGGLSDPPIFWAYVYSSSGIGTNPFNFRVGCVTPVPLRFLMDPDKLEEEGLTVPFGALTMDESDNFFELGPGGSGRLHRIEVELQARDDWLVGDLCLIAAYKPAEPCCNLTYFLEVGLE